MPESPRHAYVHVPFCRHRCGYCDFTLVAGRDDLIERYFTALTQELERICEPLELDTLYLGGGTPSHLGPDGLRRLFRLLTTKLVLADDAEVTVEANPLDVTADFVAAACECGVTRVSLGGQSLDAATLRALDRDHAPADVQAAVARLLDAGLVVNLDLMTAAPGQTLAAVEADLAAAVALGMQHVSVYCLTWEKGTAFETARRRGELQPVEEALEGAMFEMAIERLEAAGYEHYEVSNFARPGHRCRHNEAYWDCRPWEAFGPGAARFDGRTRTTNHRSTTTWIAKMHAGEDATGDVDAMTAEQAARERLVVGLRRRDGVDRAAFRAASGYEIDQLVGDGLARWVAAGFATDDAAKVRLTRGGLLVSDSLWADVLTT
ncbi:MAG: radical SAM family heme chaperone HemW [Planctomycetota bacterium]|jgi:oxygen-independent coproporphyrinogen-3 oxidase|nr:radical SAM family heme chaperone HemW [Planctomycetota bacterium]